MGMYLKLAWRNLLRNKRRTFIAGTAIGIGLAALIFYDAMMIGMENNMISTSTSSFMGEAQIHAEEFLETQDVELTIRGLDGVVEKLESEGIVEAFTLRAMAFSMLSSAGNVSAVELFGVVPETEAKLSKIDDAIIEGEFFSGDSKRDIVIGSKLAELLEVQIGDRVVATVAQANTGELSQELFRVSGIYHFGDRALDAALAFVRLPVAQEMLAIEGDVHEISIKFKDIQYSRIDTLAFWDKFSTGGNEAKSWVKLFPQLEAVFEMSQMAKGIVGMILFAIVALGIINTLFMSLHERMFEFGVIKAIGTRPFKIAHLIVFEAAFLSIISVVIGSIISIAVNSYIAHIGIDYRGMEFLGTTVQELIYPVIKLEHYIIYPIWVFILTSLVGIYPAVHAARLKPAEAMRRSV
jgi:ABC-type lipoprotein release transport system permease subunit